MRKRWMLSLCVVAFVGCNNTAKKAQAATGEEQQAETSTQPLNVGGSKDEHGCMTAAGETWSELNQTCLRLFEQGLRLNPVKEEGGTLLSAFVVFNDDQSKLQVFLPTEEQEVLILDKKEGHIYADATYTYDGKEGALYIKGQKEYAK
ncbi:MULTISPECIES: hypothetical protein [unclassified Myroides]|uniref:hypothetical protein n=1 Tax=unclassified Myroides TaxID=2642485 RepID=UPI0015F95F35|nr:MULTISPECIES: hypothetical protein [unclassified Myroides]MBB1149654.1 hypothetical protein [Myroides sp. NP-2]MDM1407126.1 hypothetical protein [Myroides sp. DF42-4-2]